MIPKPTNADIERLLAQEPYLGAEHLQNNYEILETYMAQKSFNQSRKLLTRVKKGEEIHPNFVDSARTMISYAVNELERFFTRRICFNIFKKFFRRKK